MDTDMKKFAEHYQKIVQENKELLEINDRLEIENFQLKKLLEEMQNVS